MERTTAHPVSSSFIVLFALSTSCGHGKINFLFLPSQLFLSRQQPFTTMATSPSNFTSPLPSSHRRHRIPPQLHHHVLVLPTTFSPSPLFLSTSSFQKSYRYFTCKAADVSTVTEESSSSGGGGDSGSRRNWIPIVPLSALPKGERRVVIQDDETILLLWYKDEIFAIENKSPAEGAYTEGLINAKLTQDGCIVCPTTDSSFDLRTGAVKEWYPNNPVLRLLTPALRTLYIFPVKTDDENIYISMGSSIPTDAAAEIVFSGRAQPGVTATNVNVDEVRMIIADEVEGFGFTKRNESINGKAAVIGFLLLLDFELLTGKGLLKGTGFLDFLYGATNAFK